MEPFELIISLGAGPIVLEIVRWIFKWIQVNQAKRSIAKEEFEKALRDLDLSGIGIYFEKMLGDVNLFAYAHDNATRERVDSQLRRIAILVEEGQSGEDAGDATVRAAPARAVDRPLPATAQALRFEPLAADPPSIVRALAELKKGETWNALAQLRRDVEIELAKLARLDRRQPAHRLLAQLDPPPQIRDAFSVFYSIASAAVHGEEVEVEQALFAIHRARQVIDFLSSRQAGIDGGR